MWRRRWLVWVRKGRMMKGAEAVMWWQRVLGSNNSSDLQAVSGQMGSSASGFGLLWPENRRWWLSWFYSRTSSLVSLLYLILLPSSSELGLELLLLCFFSFLLSRSPFFSFFSFFLFFFFFSSSRFSRSYKKKIINRLWVCHLHLHRAGEQRKSSPFLWFSSSSQDWSELPSSCPAHVFFRGSERKKLFWVFFFLTRLSEQAASLTGSQTEDPPWSWQPGPGWRRGCWSWRWIRAGAPSPLMVRSRALRTDLWSAYRWGAPSGTRLWRFVRLDPGTSSPVCRPFS